MSLRSIFWVCCLVSLLVASQTAYAREAMVWSCDGDGYKATLTITDKTYKLLHHTSGKAGDFVWMNADYDEQKDILGAYSLVGKRYTFDAITIEQLKKNTYGSNVCFKYESATINLKTNELYNTWTANYTDCIQQK